jgi:hypothetical protein
MSLRPSWAKSVRPYLKNKKAVDTAQRVEHLPMMLEALDSIPSTKERKKERKEGRKEGRKEERKKDEGGREGGREGEREGSYIICSSLHN